MTFERTESKLILRHTKGPTVEILWYGATILSWKSGSKSNPALSERIFVSSKSPLDGSEPVRGGIPLVFPCFAYPTHPDHQKLGIHGFARNEYWKWDGNITDNDYEISVKLALDPVPSIWAVYDKSFHLDYVVTLSEYTLKTDLHVTNTSAAPFEFQALFHTYHVCPTKDVRIKPLKGLTYYDKTELIDGKPTKRIEDRDTVDVTSWTDSVYESTSGTYEIRWPGGGVDVTTSNMDDLVIWNPQAIAGRKIAAMEEGGWDNFVCVEPGLALAFETLQPGKSWVGKQEITVR
ncbi:galactose mutarotase-like protein [Guyanagaster necrorhizus]|uniref:Glucose-6-phosphate 1-epimerase n=1 Tax=Guyanagaster necrorhizus TaxID=856835 RepID=A0A9P7VQQ3_9AGAR|nr:galactose mutarotase-like protein [Guyanagaster necrorhizus MCA 3950]KAG7444955.1 galactose mutarotase-like protein [Guyanagaster necrorhizus MCA 3950]